MKIHFSKLLLAAIVAGSSHAALAQSIDHEQITSQARQFLDGQQQALAEKGFRASYEIGNIDPRLSLAECNDPLEFSLKRDALKHQRNSVSIKCIDAGWNIFVNTDIKVFQSLVTLRSPVSKGTIITSADLTLSEQQVNKSRYGYYIDIGEVAGMVAKRSISSGTVVSPSMLTAPELVERGDEVLIEAIGSSVSIKMKGEAMRAGKLGEQISVKNLSSQRIIRAQVVGADRVRVIL